VKFRQRRDFFISDNDSSLLEGVGSKQITISLIHTLSNEI
jgi:hypothetical protein